MEFLHSFFDSYTEWLVSGGKLLGFFLLFIENFIPFLPFHVFVTMNMHTFGVVGGFFASYIGTVCGSYLLYLCFYFIGDKISRKVLSKKFFQKVMETINHFQDISFPALTLLYSLPFVPTFFVNVLSGLSKIEKKKYITAIVIGKVFTVLFWGFVGLSIIENVSNWRTLAFIVVILIVSYVISRMVGKKFHIE